MNQGVNGVSGRIGRESVKITIGLRCQNGFETVMFPEEKCSLAITLNMKVR